MIDAIEQSPPTGARLSAAAWRTAPGLALLRVEPLALALLSPLLWYPGPRSHWLLAVIPLFWLVRLVVEGRPLVRTAVDGPVLCFVLLLPLSLVGVADWGLAYPRLLGILVGLALVYALAAWPRSPRQAVYLAAGLAAAVALASTAAGFVGTAWELNAQKLFRLGGLYDQLPRTIGALARATPRGGINPNETAGALVIFVPLLLLLAVALAGGRSRWAGVLRLCQIGGLAAVVALLLLTQSRGGIVGAVAGLGVAALWLLGQRPGRGWVAAGLALTATVVVCAGLLWTLVASSGGISGGRSTFAARNEIWFRAVYMVQDSPWVGVGLGQFRRVIFSDYAGYTLGPDPRLRAGSLGVDLPERAVPRLAGFDGYIPHAHNFVLQNAVDFGLPGLAALVALLLAWLRALWRASRRTEDAAVRALAAGLVGGMAAFLAFGLNDTIVLGARGGLAFWLVLGLGLGVARAVPALPGREPSRFRLGQAILLGCALLAALPSLAVVTTGATAPCRAGAAGGAPVGWVGRFGQAVAYPASVGVAEVVELRGCAPEAVALRWADAAAHARTPSQVERVDAALAAQGDRLGSRTRLAELLAGAAGPSADPRVACSVERLRGRFCRPA